MNVAPLKSRCRLASVAVVGALALGAVATPVASASPAKSKTASTSKASSQLKAEPGHYGRSNP